MWDGFMNHMGSGWGIHGFGLIWMVLFWGLVIAAIVFLVRAIVAGGERDRSPQGTDRALEILEERFARGELSQEEFEAKKRVLDKG